MDLFLLILGLIITVTGIGAVGYGAANIDFGFGHTLLVVGTTVAGSGLVVIALAVAVRELRRMADLLAARPPELHAPAAVSAEQPARVAADERPPRRPDLDLPRRELPRFGAPDTPTAASADLLAEADMPPLPSTPRWAQPRPAEDSSLRPSMLEGFATSSPSPRERAKDESLAAPSPGGTSAQRLPGGPSDRPSAEPAQPPGRQGVSILKSGVVDGMAYTLYSDGSIEAQLPQGTMRFNSIEELRLQLEGEG
jgi:hypothetical protein